MLKQNRLQVESEKAENGSSTDSAYFRSLIERLAGISMSPAKHELVTARLRSRLNSLGGMTLKGYQKYLESLPRDHAEWQVFINMLTTNKTDFFREPQHFDYLVQTFLSRWLKGPDPILRIWSAASSTGEEPYTLSMVLDRHLPKDRDYQIFATDIDTDVLRTAQNAVYPLSKLSEIPIEYQTTSIDRGSGDIKDWFRIKQRIKSKITFQRHNLMDAKSPADAAFDLVFCRNVLIYFNRQGIEFVAQKLFRSAKPQGQLFIGHSETLQGISSGWRSQVPAVYKKGGST